MAGNWIKMRNDLAEDPAVIGIAAALQLDEFAVVGRLQHLWSWADQQTRDGHADGVTCSWIDRKVQRDGFAEAMQRVGWLEVTETGVCIPKFDRHNGESAKTRALGSNRKQKQRSLSAEHPEEVTPTSRNERDKNVTREEKRRDTTPKGVVDAASGSKATRGTRLPKDWAMAAQDRAFCAQQRPDLKPEEVEAQFRDFWTAKPGKDGAKLDWPATWRNWVRGQRRPPGAPQAPSANWWDTKTGHIERGRELGLGEPIEGKWNEFMASVWVAMGEGPWWDKRCQQAYAIACRLRDGGSDVARVVMAGLKKEAVHAR